LHASLAGVVDTFFAVAKARNRAVHVTFTGDADAQVADPRGWSAFLKVVAVEVIAVVVDTRKFSVVFFAALPKAT
jgi:hypothetical protein